MKILLVIFITISIAHTKEIALTFDDAPGELTQHFTPEKRTEELLRKLKDLNVPPVIIFANPCNGNGADSNLVQLKKFKEAGHIIGNHTCTHPKLDEVGAEQFIADTLKAETLLDKLLPAPKYFRYPFFNEGKNIIVRDQVRSWLGTHDYQNISSSLENEDPIFSAKINEAKRQKKKINYDKVKKFYLKHVLDGVAFYDDLSLKVLGRSPKHIILLHDKDATVLFIDDLVRELRKRGWTIISAADAVKDPLYSMKPKNVYSTFGILSQVAYEKNGRFEPYYDFKKMVNELNLVLELTPKK